MLCTPMEIKMIPVSPESSHCKKKLWWRAPADPLPLRSSRLHSRADLHVGILYEYGEKHCRAHKDTVPDCWHMACNVVDKPQGERMQHGNTTASEHPGRYVPQRTAQRLRSHGISRATEAESHIVWLRCFHEAHTRVCQSSKAHRQESREELHV